MKSTFLVPTLFKKKSFIFISISLLILSALFFYIAFSQINTHHKESIVQQKNILFKEAVSLFETMIKVRQWNAEHGGVYVKQRDGLVPNPYLRDNILKIDDNNTLIKINPAWMTKQISSLINQDTKKYYKITSLKPINPQNSPDAFELEALNYFLKNSNEKYYYQNLTFNSSQTMYNFMGRLDTEKSCMECHSAQGYKIGDLRGGIRITIPINEYKESISIENEGHIFNKSVILIMITILVILFLIVMYLIIRDQKKLEEFNNLLESTVEARTKELHDLNINLEERVSDELFKNKEKDQLMITQSRHAAMGEMISMLAHQWRQPISIISMDANNMMVDIQLEDMNPKQFKEYAQGIIEQTEQLSNIIDDFSNFISVKKEKETILLSAVVNECFKMIGPSLNAHGIEYEVITKDEKPILICSRELLQVILNLVGNAKEILIKHQTPNPKITIYINQKDELSTIEVCDNGVGISADVLPHIFEPYFSTKDKKNGTGLGLYMSRMIIETNFNGELIVETKEMKTCFSIVLNNNES